MQGLAADPSDAVDSSVAAVAALRQKGIQPDVAVVTHTGCSRRDHDSIRAGDQNRGYLASSTVKGNGFRDGNSAEAAWIQRVDLTACGGLGNCARPCLARCRAAPRVGIIAHTRNPRPPCLPAHHGRATYT